MMKTTMISATVCGLLLSTSVALAATSLPTNEAPTMNLEGPYLGGGFTQSFIDDSAIANYDGSGVDLFAGYKSKLFSSWAYGIEVEFLFLGEIDNVDFSSTALSGIIEYQLNSKLSINAKAGAVTEDYTYLGDDYSSDVTGLVGTALQYHWRPRWSAYVSYEHTFGESLSQSWTSKDPIAVDLVGLGVQYTL